MKKFHDEVVDKIFNILIFKRVPKENIHIVTPMFWTKFFIFMKPSLFPNKISLNICFGVKNYFNIFIRLLPFLPSTNKNI